MIETNPLLLQTLFKSSLPLLFGGSYYLLKVLFSSSDFHRVQHDGFLKSQQQSVDAQNNDEMRAGVDLLSQLDQMTIWIYTSFFAFVFTMLLIDLFLKIAKDSWREGRLSVRSRPTAENSYAKEWRLFNLMSENQIKRIFCYTVIFLSLQIGGLCLNLLGENEISITYPAITPFQISLMSQENPRILAEEEKQQLDNTSLQTLPPMIPDKISLSMGNVLSSLNLNVNAMVLSKDKKTAFVTIDFYGNLKIIDISDPQAPLIIGSLNLIFSSYNFRVKSLLLSSDEKTLYASNSRDLEIIDVTEPSSPKIISQTPSQLFIDPQDGDTSSFFKTSIVVSEKTKTLYIGGLGFQVYNIIDPKKPVFLKGWNNERIKHRGAVRSEICLSQDEQILFIANGTLEVYNISDPHDMKLLNSFQTESSPRSLLLDEDQKTVMLLGTSKNREIIYEEVNIANLSSLNVSRTLKLDGHRSELYPPLFIGKSPNKSKIFIFAYSSYSEYPDLLVFDRITKRTIKTENSLIKETFTIDFSLDGKTLITGSNQRFKTIELFLDYPNKQIFSPSQENVIQNISIPSCHKMQMSDDGNYLFALCRIAANSNKDILTIWDVKDCSKPRAVYQTNGNMDEMHLLENLQTVYLRSGSSIIVLDVSNREKIELKGTYELHNGESHINYFLPSFDGKTGFIIRNGFSQADISFINLSNAGPVEIFSKLDLKVDLFNGRLILKDDGKTLIFLGSSILIYNVSNVLDPREIAFLPLGVNEPNPYINSHRLSADEKTLFIQTFDQSSVKKLKIYNVSDVTTPQLISETYFPRWGGVNGIELSPDLKSGYVSQPNSLIKLNLTDLKQPQIIGIMPLPKNKLNYVLSPDGHTVYASYPDKISAINLEIEYTMFLKQEKFLLGKKYSDKVAMLRLNPSSSDYSIMDTESYKIIKLSFLDMKVGGGEAKLEMKTSSLPSWMSFDRESHTLTVESKKQREIGTYTVCSTFSLKISNTTFEELGTAENPISREDLWAWLISLDYIDPKLYLKENFGEIDEFFLPSNFSLYREQIYNILKKYRVETCTGFEVVSSLELKEDKNLTVSSLSYNSMKVEVKLEPRTGVDAKFVNRPYGSLIPVIKENKTRISLEGSIKEVNLALNSLVVNYENGTFCDANLVINDGLNLPVSKGIKNTSSYFRANIPPKVNQKVENTVQEQIAFADIQTGKYFMWTFSDDIFEDEYAESLEYEVAMARSDIDFPIWLSFNGLTLKGTPPEEISGRDLDLILIAKNEFKKSQIPFRLHISISGLFWLKLLMRYSPYILTMIGLFVSANKIFNILRKDFYKHSKEFYVGVGQEISGEVIFPIMFIEEEQKQSELILKEMGGGEEDIKVDDFIIDQERKIIDKEKIASRVQEAIQKMPADRKKQTTPSPVIDQIITNKFVWKQLHSRKEIETKRLFESLRANCLELVERNASGFTIDHEKLMKRIQRISTEANDTLTLEDSLLSQEVNIDLLKDAILAFAFENHSIDVSPVDVDIGVKQKVPSNFLFRFLKLDLKEIYLDYKNKMNYGINYQIIDDKLCFYGISQNYFKGKTVVVQIKTERQRIMKEIWIHGVGERDVDSKNYLTRDEQESRGQGYEIY